LTVDAAIKNILEGHRVTNESNMSFTEIHFDRESKYFIYSVQGVESIRDRKLMLALSDLRSKDWKIVDIRTSTT
jgi:hypothetical protein